MKTFTAYNEGDRLYTGHVLTLPQAIQLNNAELYARDMNYSEESLNAKHRLFQVIALLDKTTGGN